MHSSQFGITFTDSRGPVNSDGPIHCIRSLNRMVRYSVMPVCVEMYVEDIKNLKVIVTRQENSLQAMDLRLARAMRIIHMLTHPLLNGKFKNFFFFKTRCKLLVETAATSNNAGIPRSEETTFE